MEQVPNTFPALFWGYAAIWVLLCLFLFRLARKIESLKCKKNSEDSR